MDHMMRFVQSRLKQRKQYRQGVALVIKEYLKPLAVDPAAVQVRLTQKYCTLLLGMNEDKTKRFLQKDQLRKQINKHLVDHGREVTLQELRIA